MSGSTNTHARKAPSGAKRWANCTASLAEETRLADEIFACQFAEVRLLTPYLQSIPEKELSEDEKLAIKLMTTRPGLTLEDLTDEERDAIAASSGNEYTREGTRAHDFAERILNGQLKLEDIPKEFRAPVGVYVEECFRLIAEEPEGEFFVESKVPLFYNNEDEEATGTVDFALATEPCVTILDLKYGQGVLVDVYENPQLAIYAKSLMEDLADIYSFDAGTLVRIGIAQPRHHGGAPIRYWEINKADLDEFCESIQQASDDIDHGVLKYDPGEETCRWCPLPVKTKCAARLAALEECVPTGRTIDALDLLPDLEPRGAATKHKKLPADERLDLYGLDMEGTTDEDLLVIYRNRKGWIQFLDDIADYLLLRQVSGDPVEGTKLVLGREGNRTWVDEEEAEQLLINQRLKKEERCTFKVISPTEAEKVLAAKLDEKSPSYSVRLANKFKKLIFRSAAKPVLALEDDKRPAIAAGVSLLPDLTDAEGDMPENITEGD